MKTALIKSKPARVSRDRFYHFRVSDEDIEKIKRNAAIAGMRTSVFVRDLALSGGNMRITPRTDENTAFELRKIGAMLKSLYPKNANWTNEEKRQYWAAMNQLLEYAEKISSGKE